MSKFKELYQFVIPRMSEEYEETPKTREDGTEYLIKEKVQKEIPVEFCLRKPTRALFDEADLYYNVTVSKGLMAGLLSAALLAKRFENDGGTMSEPEKQAWADKFAKRYSLEIEFQQLSTKLESDRSEEEKVRFIELIREIASLNKELQAYELREQSLYDITAESRARKLTVGWWLLFLLHKKEKGQWVPFFEGTDDKQKQSAFDDVQDEELPTEEREFNKKVIDHAYKATALWYYGRAGSQEEFLRAITTLNEPKVPTEEAKVSEEPKGEVVE